MYKHFASLFFITKYFNDLIVNVNAVAPLHFASLSVNDFLSF